MPLDLRLMLDRMDKILDEILLREFPERQGDHTNRVLRSLLLSENPKMEVMGYLMFEYGLL